MDYLNQLTERLQTLFGPLAQQAALETELRVRPSRAKLDGPTTLLALVGGWWKNPQASRQDLASSAGVSKQALSESLNAKMAEFLKAVLDLAVEQLVGVEPLAQPLLEKFAGVYIFDSSVISLPPALAQTWPGCGKPGTRSAAGIKLHTGLELTTGTLLGPALSAARTHDRAGPDQNRQLPQRALRICDLGYADLGRLAELAEQQVYYLSRIVVGTKVRAKTKPSQVAPYWQPLGEWLEQHPAPDGVIVIDQAVELGQTQKLPARLVAWPVTDKVRERRQAQFKQVERKRQRAISDEQRRLSEWSVYITNLPVELVSPQELSVLYRMRWQIERVFKLWKSEGAQLEEWRSKKPQAILCELYAKLIGVVVSHWTSLLVWQDEEGLSLGKLSRVVREHAAAIVTRLGQKRALEEELNYLRVDLSQQALLEAGYNQRLNSFQLRLNPPLLT